jgi:hypothetical protein
MGVAPTHLLGVLQRPGDHSRLWFTANERKPPHPLPLVPLAIDTTRPAPLGLRHALQRHGNLTATSRQPPPVATHKTQIHHHSHRHMRSCCQTNSATQRESSTQISIRLTAPCAETLLFETI